MAKGTGAAPAQVCVHHWRQIKKGENVTLFRCLKCKARKEYPNDPPVAEGQPGYNKGKKLLEVTRA